MRLVGLSRSMVHKFGRAEALVDSATIYQGPEHSKLILSGK